MEHPRKGGTSPGTLFKVAAEIAEFHLMEVRDAQSKKGESDDKMCLLRSAAGEAGQRERGRGFPAFRRTVGQR
jgi:hypothetical protein